MDKLTPDAQNLESYQIQKRIDDRKHEIGSSPDATPLEKVENLWLDAITCCQTVLFTLGEGDPTIEEIKAAIPEFEVIAQVGNAYSASIPANDANLGQFCKLYSGLGDPSGEELAELEKQTNEKLAKGFFSPPLA